ncbi:MAG: hypothetical protein HPY89_04275 [Pelotomaculum sp.]|uniref:Hypothetical membrane protein n=1 Tax=Pelotomaculum thermopropionicum (strain DSM 13744 / JCM 10971 / SI) TaxID=370438 RepID=A5D3A7_PELTS|nr:hypothetical protein [Pelotomaculum sp.]BAF59268.1 hypothetical membrane protein [Pelotomaculum thermopropionicum SI]
MSHKKFVRLFCLITGTFLIFHLFLYGFTRKPLALPEKLLKRSAVTGRHEPMKQAEAETIGDLARLSYLYRLGVPRVVRETSDEMGYLNKNYGGRAVFPVVTVGDSFMLFNGDGQRFNNLLEQILGVNCYNMAANGVEDPFAFLQGGLIKEARVLVWESAERNISADVFNLANVPCYYANARKKLEYNENWEKKGKSPKRLRAVNLANVKFLINNLAYLAAGKPLLGDAGLVRLKNGKELLFYKNDLYSFKRPNFEQDLRRSAEFIAYVDRELKKHGITLIFLAVPDKYNAYYEQIADEEKLSGDARFIDRLTEELKRNGVLAVNLIGAFRDEINKGNDLYHFDDTHWNTAGAGLAARLVAEEIKRHRLLEPDAPMPEAAPEI